MTMMNNLRKQQGGFTYLLLLIALSVLAMALLKSTDEITMRYRERQEKELLFRGEQIRAAIASYRAVGHGCFPTDFAQLLDDERGMKPVYHLRQHYRDPLTNQETWAMLYDPDGRWIGVTSAGNGTPLRKAGFSEEAVEFSKAKTYQDWKFTVKSDLNAPLPTACGR
jgi:type II secretory pathway pseudopilin PulG